MNDLNFQNEPKKRFKMLELHPKIDYKEDWSFLLCPVPWARQLDEDEVLATTGYQLKDLDPI